MKPEIRKVINTFIRDNPEANKAYKAMISRGLSEEWAKAEVARVLTACLWEVSCGITTDTKRLDTALQALAKGHSAEELFPDELYESGGDSPKSG